MKIFMMTKEYIRDGRAPIPLKDSTSRVMRANKDRDTKPELLLRRALWKSGLRGYRLHWKKVPGRPDIAYPGKKIAIFVNGCFWHRCPHCNPHFPKSNQEFWTKKFQANQERDNRKKEELKKLGWFPIEMWECQIKNNVSMLLFKLKNIITNINFDNNNA